jgi:hypothetical protein
MLNFSDINHRRQSKIPMPGVRRLGSSRVAIRNALSPRQPQFEFVAVSRAMHFRLIFLLFLYLVERTDLRLSRANVIWASSSASRMPV